MVVSIYGPILEPVSSGYEVETNERTMNVRMDERTSEDDTFVRTFQDKRVLELPVRVAFQFLYRICRQYTFLLQFCLHDMVHLQLGGISRVKNKTLNQNFYTNSVLSGHLARIIFN